LHGFSPNEDDWTDSQSHAGEASGVDASLVAAIASVASASPRAATALSAIDPLVERLKADPSLQTRLAHPGPVPEVGEIVALVRFLDNLTMTILTGGVTERLILAEYADDIVQLWDRLGEVTRSR
jgi:hypothetical protein